MSDITMRGSFPRDDNSVPITVNGLLTSKAITFTGDGATVETPLFHITGTVQVLAIYGVVTTTLANHTAAYLRLNDQGAQVDITLNTGTSLTNLTADSVIIKKGLATAAITKLDNAAGRVSEPTTLETMYPSQFVAMKKTGAVTDIEYVYTTSDSPTTGAITFYCGWVPVSADGRVTPV